MSNVSAGEVQSLEERAQEISQPHCSACMADQFGMYCNNPVAVLSFVKIIIIIK